jgi:hypothetical protein
MAALCEAAGRHVKADPERSPARVPAALLRRAR